jgi:hypothetical protein
LNWTRLCIYGKSARIIDRRQFQKRIFDKLAQEQAVREEDVQQWLTRVNAAQHEDRGSPRPLYASSPRQLTELPLSSTSWLGL